MYFIHVYKACLFLNILKMVSQSCENELKGGWFFQMHMWIFAVPLSSSTPAYNVRNTLFLLGILLKSLFNVSNAEHC